MNAILATLVAVALMVVAGLFVRRLVERPNRASKEPPRVSRFANESMTPKPSSRTATPAPPPASKPRSYFTPLPSPERE